jgi:hypothetical protein
MAATLHGVTFNWAARGTRFLSECEYVPDKFTNAAASAGFSEVAVRPEKYPKIYC